MSRAQVFFLTSLAMVAFAGNSLLCRLALKHTAIDPASFTWIRIGSGAVVLWLVVRIRNSSATPSGNWPSAAALFVYAAYLFMQPGPGMSAGSESGIFDSRKSIVTPGTPRKTSGS